MRISDWSSDVCSSDLHVAVRELLAATVTMPQRTARIDDALDGIFLHPIFGLAILAVLMFLIFQAVFSWATPIMDGIGAGILALGTLTTQRLPDGALNSLLENGRASWRERGGPDV